MKRISTLLVVLCITLSTLAVGCQKAESETTELDYDEGEVIKTVAWQCDHTASLAFDTTADIQSEYDIDENTYTLWVMNTSISATDMKNFDWRGNGATILNLETSLNNLGQSIKNVFDESELESEEYTVIIHFTDSNKEIYFTSENGVTTYSVWG